MATHDYVIDNSTGANVRTDINNVLQAILTNNSSSSAPSTTAAYMWWADTTTGILKIRNSANNAWVELLQLDGTLTLEDGSASNPALAFRDDLDTGLFSSAANFINFAVGGVEVFELSGNATVFNESGADIDFRIEGDTETNLFFVNAGGNSIGVGTSAPNSGRLHVTHSSGTIGYFESTQAAANVANIVGNATDTNSSANLILQVNSGTSAQGIFRLNGNSSIDFLSGATPTQKMRLDQNGNLGIGTTTPTGRLELAVGASTACVLRLTSNNTGSNAGDRGRIEVFSSKNDGTAFEAGQIVIDRTSSTEAKAKFQVFLNNDSGVAKAFEILNDGNVGFNGSSAAACAIDIEGNQVDIGNPLGNGVSNGINPTFRALVTGKNILFSSMWGGDNQLHKHLEFSGGANIFYVGTDDSEIARTDGNGLVVGSTSFDSNNSIGVRLLAHGAVHSTRSNEFAYIARRSDSNGGIFLFRRDSTDVGNISVTTSATSYNSGSDYRLKQDDTPLIDGLTRLKELKPIKFRWKNDTSAFVDGFFAHEVSEIVPNAITGEKDAVYEEDDELGHKKGDPIYQQIDHGKLVPLLVAAVQELSAKVENLEAR